VRMPVPPLPTLALIAALAAVASPCAAKVTRIAPDARTHAVKLRWIGSHELTEPEIRREVATRAPSGAERVNAWVAWLPLVPDPPPRPFVPFTLQEDVARLRRLYARQGFPEASIDYEVETDDEGKDVTVTITIREGEPIRVRRLNLARMDSTLTPTMDPDEAARGRRELRQLGRTLTGRRLGAVGIEDIRRRTVAWMAEHGHLAPHVEVLTMVDTAGRAADVTLLVEAGTRSRVGEITVKSDPPVEPRLLARHLPFKTGDWVSSRDVQTGLRNLRSIDLFRDATIEVPVSGPADSVVPVRIAFTPSRPRLTTLGLGYVTSGAGVSMQAGWTHPNLTGGARAVDLVGLWQTGLWSFSDVPDKLFRVTLTMRQPYVGFPAASLSFGPRVELRDDLYERSNVFSWLVTYVYPYDALQTFSLSFDQSYTRILELRFGGVSVNRDELAKLPGGDLLAALNGEGNVQQWTASLRRGRLDDQTLPRHGITVRPSFTTTGPSAFTDVQFARGDVQATTFMPVPLGNSALMLRGSVGRVWPYGSSLPAPGTSGLAQFLRLRDYNFIAGGSGDVRGYDTGLLGPKFPHTSTGTEGEATSDYYDPVTGLARAMATAELRLPLPGATSQLALHTFLDAGRVWIPDSRYSFRLIDENETHWFMTTGGGLGYYSPIGAMRIEGGYMLNPSLMDVRDAAEVQRAIIDGVPIEDVPAHSRRRLRIHLSLAMWF